MDLLVSHGFSTSHVGKKNHFARHMKNQHSGVCNFFHFLKAGCDIPAFRVFCNAKSS